MRRDLSVIRLRFLRFENVEDESRRTGEDPVAGGLRRRDGEGVAGDVRMGRELRIGA